MRKYSINYYIIINKTLGSSSNFIRLRCPQRTLCPVIIAFHILVLAHLLYSVQQTHVQIAYKQSQFLCFLITINLE